MNEPKRNHVRPLIQHGRALSVNIPLDMQRRLGWNRYDNIHLEVVDGCLICTKVNLPNRGQLRDRAAASRDGE